MSKTKTPRRDDEEQSKLFLKKAHELDADRKNSKADELISHLAKKPPEPRKGGHK
jgi:hypothetical protein